MEKGYVVGKPTSGYLKILDCVITCLVEIIGNAVKNHKIVFTGTVFSLYLFVSKIIVLYNSFYSTWKWFLFLWILILKCIACSLKNFVTFLHK